MSEQASLALCNLVSQGMSLKEARMFLLKQEETEESNSEQTEVKLSLPERKQIIADEIEALGYESPAPNASLAKFEEALAYAKEQSEGEGKTADML